jgi:hypothetical protein
MSLAQKLARLADIFGGNQSGYGIPFSNRNYMIDGNFESWINTSVSVTGGANTASAATVFTGISGTGGAATISRQAWTLGAVPIGMTTPSYYYQHAQTTAGTGTPAIDQHIESVQTLAGRSATFSCWLWCASGTVVNPTVQFAQNFGTGGSPSATVTNQIATGWTITTTPTRFSIRLDFPSITGKTLGTNGNDMVDFAVIFPNGTFTVNTAQWQLEQTSPQAPSTGLPTAFEYRGPQAELARVQRYYDTGARNVQLYGSQGWAFTEDMPFKVTMRSTPAVNLGTTSGTNITLSTSNAAANHFEITKIYTSTGVGAAGVSTTWTADARL